MSKRTVSQTPNTTQEARNVRFRHESGTPFPPERNFPGGESRNGRLDEEDQVVEDDRKRVLSLFAPGRGKLAAAYYEPETRKLYVLEDTVDNASWDLAALGKASSRIVDADEVIISAKSHDGLMDRVDQYCKAGACSYVALPSYSFRLATATDHLASCRLPDRSAIVTEDEDDIATSMSGSYHTGTTGNAETGGAGMGKRRLSMVKLGCWINVDAPTAICAAGGLLSHLIKEQAFGAVIGEGPKLMELTGIESLALEEHMLINEDALTSLSIMGRNEQNTRGSDKTSVSLFSLLHTTVTSAGTKLLHAWFLRPLLDLEAIAARHDAVGTFSDPQYQQIGERIQRCLKKIKNLGAIFWKIRVGKAKAGDWDGIVTTLSSAKEIKEIVSWMGGKRLPIVDKVMSMIDEKALVLHANIVDVVDFDESFNEGRICVQSGLDEELDEWKQRYNSEPEAASESFLNLESKCLIDYCLKSEHVPRGLVYNLRVVYLPQMGHLVAVTQMDNTLLDLPGWHFHFRAETEHYYKCPQMAELDQHLGDLFTNIIALAHAAKVFDLNRPVMKENPTLKIHRGRHLLYEAFLESSTYIANDTRMCGGYDEELDSMMIVTGANGSGKTAYGKQIGSFVPAQKAEIGVCDRIFTRLQTKESASKPASAFMIDLAQISLALRGATPRSLLVLDEFGKGTDPSDGAGLLAGVIQNLMEGPRPRTIILTHFHALFTNRFMSADMPICFSHMETILQPDTLDMAYLFSDILSKFEVSRLLDGELTQEDRQELQDAEKLARRFLDWDIDDDAIDVRDSLVSMLNEGMDEFNEVY
ncbi:DNA mismatch repair protein MSH5, partial [Tremellales sp. Uapishka_1]